MGIDFKAKLTAQNFNDAFMCRNEDTDTTGNIKANGYCSEKTSVTAAATLDLATDTGTIEITGTGPVDVTSFTSTIIDGQQVTIINNTDGDITFSVFTGKTVTLPANCSMFLIGCGGTLVPSAPGGGSSSTGGKFVDGADPSQAVYMDGLVGIGEDNPNCMLTISNQADGNETIDPLCITDLEEDATLTRYLVQDASGVVKYKNEADIVAALEPPVVLAEIVASGTNGPAFPAGTWEVRNLNNITTAGSWVNLGANGQFTLTPGTYCIDGSAPAFQVLRHRVALWNVTLGAFQRTGTSAFAKNGTSTEGYTHSFIKGVFTITATSVFEFQHRAQQFTGFAGMGLASGFGIPELYAQLKITKIS